MKKDEYAPGLTVYTEDLFMRGMNRGQIGETISPEPLRNPCDKSFSFAVLVRWRNGTESVVKLARLKAVRG
jgi:hypothetical protein